MRTQVLQWDVLDGDVLGALIVCPDCPCTHGSGCDGTGVLHRRYLLPGGHQIDLYRDAEIIVQLLDRSAPGVPVGDEQGGAE